METGGRGGMALDDGALRVLRQNLPDDCLDAGGAPLASALAAKPESTARAMDLMEMKIDALQQELERLVRGSGAGPAASSGGHALVAQAAQLRGSVDGMQARLGDAHGAVGPALELPLAAVEAAAASRAELLQQVQTHDQLAGVMAALSLLKDAVARYDADIAVGALDAAARSVCVLEGMLRDEPLAGLAAAGARSVGGLTGMVAGKRAELGDAAATVIRQSFVVGRRGSGKDAVVRCRFRSVLPIPSGALISNGHPRSAEEAATVQIPTAWACLNTLGSGLGKSSVRAVAEALHSHFIDPLFSRPEAAASQGAGTDEAPGMSWELQVDDVVRGVDGNVAESGSATLRLRPSDPGGATLPREAAAGHAETRLLGPLAQLVEVLHAVTCASNSHMCGAFGSEMWPRLTEQLAESGRLQARDAEAVGVFESRLRKVGFVVEVDCAGADVDADAGAGAGAGAGADADALPADIDAVGGSARNDQVANTATTSSAVVTTTPSLVGHVEGLRHREAKQACAQLLHRARGALLINNADDTSGNRNRDSNRNSTSSLEMSKLLQHPSAEGSLGQTALFVFPVCETSAAAQSLVTLLRECVELAASRYADEPGMQLYRPVAHIHAHISLIGGPTDWDTQLYLNLHAPTLHVDLKLRRQNVFQERRVWLYKR
jgi:hypothetical protein